MVDPVNRGGEGMPLLSGVGFVRCEVICDERGEPANYRFLAVNSVAESITGKPTEAIVGKTILDLFPETDAHWIRTIGRVALTGDPIHFEEYHSGLERWLEVTAYCPEPNQFAAVYTDVTERRAAQEALRVRTKEAREAQRLAQIGSSYRDLKTGEIVWSDELYRIFGRNPKLPPPHYEEFRESFAPESRARLDAARRSLVEEYVGFDLELELLRADGAPQWIRYRAEVELDADARPTSFRGTVQDVTERWLAGQALRESERQYRTIVETMSEGVWIIDRDNYTTFVNQQMAAMLGYTVEEMLGRSLLDFKDEEARGIALENLARRRRGVSEQYDSSYQAKDGRILKMLISTIPLWDGNRSYAGSLGILTNITERTLLEERLRQAHKMEAIGRLAGGVAHDFNNLLTVINGYGDLLLSEMPAGSRAHTQLTEIRKAGRRAQELTSQMLAFSRNQTKATEILSLGAMFEDMEKMLRRMIGEDVEMIAAFEPALWPIRADRSEIAQVLMNLAVNARDAMPKGGTLRFEGTNVVVDEAFARKHPGARPGAHVLLVVTDTGIGMDWQVQQHLFEPFFTTKEVGKGTGLGLATVYGIVSQRNGWVQVESKPRQGAAFRIYLPRADAIPLRNETAATAGQTLRGTETILVVEDQPQVRELTCCILRELGYQVLDTANPEEALRLVKAHAGPLDLLLTDAVMPRVHGLELAARLREIRSLPVLLMSGYPAGANGANHPGIAYIQKPFAPEVLAAKVREILGASQPR